MYRVTLLLYPTICTLKIYIMCVDYKGSYSYPYVCVCLLTCTYMCNITLLVIAVRVEGRVGPDGRVYEGILYLMNENQWGTVCGLMFNDADATVACRDLHFRMGRVIYR